jgi:hypothetical protein
LVEAEPLAWKFAESFIDELFKFWRVGYALEYLPKIMLHGARKPFEIRIGLNSFSERRRLHLNHKKSCAY